MTRPLKSSKRLTKPEGRTLETHVFRPGFTGCAGWLDVTPDALASVLRCGPARPEIVDRVRAKMGEAGR